MNPLIKQALIWIVEAFIAHEASLASHVSNAEVKKLGAEAVVICKNLLPLLQAA